MTDNSAKISPRLLKGFRDTLPQQELVRQRLLTHIRDQFDRHGFVPIDTPILEYSEILLGKGGEESDKQLYRFTDQGGRDVAMRYDLTVPLARFAAQHAHELRMPLRRYQIGKVFRGENPQRGRFREFIQCDFDILGSNDIVSDYDALQLPLTALAAVIPPSRLQLRLSHRDLLPLLIERGDDDTAAEMREKLPAMRVIIDKIHNIGAVRIRAELGALLVNTPSAVVDELMTAIQQELHTVEELQRAQLPDPDGRLSTLLALLRTHHPEVGVIVDPSIMRGLAYYTGVIFEIYHVDAMKIGALSSGGRYDSLMARYRNDPLPAVGGSIGIDRLLSLPMVAEQIEAKSSVRALIFYERGSAVEASDLLATAHRLRQAGIAVEIYPQPTKLQRQFSYAEEKGISYGIVLVKNSSGVLQYEAKNLQTKKRVVCETIEALLDYFD